MEDRDLKLNADHKIRGIIALITDIIPILQYKKDSTHYWYQQQQDRSYPLALRQYDSMANLGHLK